MRSWFAKLDEISRLWLESKGKKELDFMVGEIGGPDDHDRRIFLVLDSSENPIAFISYVPVWGSERPGYLHDLTRRIPDAPSGAMELCNAEAIARLRAEGVKYLHFGFTPFIIDGAESEVVEPADHPHHPVAAETWAADLPRRLPGGLQDEVGNRRHRARVRRRPPDLAPGRLRPPPLDQERLMQATLTVPPTRPPPRLFDRIYQERITGGPNAHTQPGSRSATTSMVRCFGPMRLMINYVVIESLKHSPSLALKRVLLRCLGMRLGRGVTIASGVMFDFFFPDLIEIGENTIIGMDALLLTHEFLHDRIPRRAVADRRQLPGGGPEHGPGRRRPRRRHRDRGHVVWSTRGPLQGAFAGGVPIRLLERQSGRARAEQEES